MEECGLYLGRQEVGRLRWERRQSRLWLEAICPYVPEQIYRLVVETETGLRPLGVMLPENGLFVLRREIPAGEAPLRAVLDRSRPGESHLPGLPLAASAFSPAAEEEPEDGIEIDHNDPNAGFDADEVIQAPVRPVQPQEEKEYVPLEIVPEIKPVAVEAVEPQ